MKEREGGGRERGAFSLYAATERRESEREAEDKKCFDILFC